MELGTVIGPAVVAAGVSGVIAVIGLLVNRSTTIRLHTDKPGADQKLAERKIDYGRHQAAGRP